MKNKTGRRQLADRLTQFFETASATYLPHLSIDSVIFSFHEGKLKVLLCRFVDTAQFVLPGGFIKKTESIEEAAIRILEERTSLRNVYLEQFYSSGSLTRSDKAVLKTFEDLLGGLPAGHFLDQRFVTICYYALIQYSKGKVNPGIFDLGCEWVNCDEVPQLLFDHNQILSKAITRLQEDLDRKMVGFRLLHDPFTMSELQELYEAIHRKSFVRTNFQRRMLGMNVLRRVDKKFTGQSNKAPYTYTVSDKAVDE